MLIDFTMTNFKSFKRETVLSAEAGERLRKYQDTNTLMVNQRRVLKNILIFGPNGSGKSNLLEGLRQMQRMVLKDPESASQPLIATQFALDSESQQRETQFAVTFSINQQIYQYEFTYNAKEITSERLVTVLKTRQRVYFERKGATFKSRIAALKQIAARTKKNSLVLYTAMQNNMTVPTAVFTWFAEDLLFVDDYQQSLVVSDLVGLVKDVTIKKQLLEFLHFADFNIVDLEVNERSGSIGDWSNYRTGLPTNQLLAVHKVYDKAGRVVGKQRLSIDSESRGTQKILMVALAFINAELNGSGKTLLFDEFDDSLHLELSRAMIKIFNSVANRNQFILTTHELQLLDTDIRIDQIYLVEKDFKGVSELTSIFDFKDTRNSTRGGISYMKRYVEGRFGATPIIDSDEMLAALTIGQREAGE